MTVGIDPISIDDFNRANGAPGGNYEIAGNYDSTEVSPETAFSIDSNTLILSGGIGSGAKMLSLPAAMFADGNAAVEMRVDARHGFVTGALLRRSTPVGPSFDAYVVGVYGSNAYIGRIKGGVLTELVNQYHSIFESSPVWLRATIDDVGGNPNITLQAKTSEGGSWGNVLPSTPYVDSSTDKVTAVGGFGYTTLAYYDSGLIVRIDDLKIYGNAAASSEDWGFRFEDLYSPNADTLVPNASGVRVIIRDAVGGAELSDESDGEIVDGTIEYLYGSSSSTVDVELRWTESGEQRFYAETTTLINLSASGEFEPLVHINFDGLSNGQAVFGTGSVEGKRFSSVPADTAFAGGYGVQASTAQARPGKASSCAMSIASGSDGDPSGGDTGVGYGSFGGIVEIPGGVAEGEELWWGQWVFFPVGWRWDSATAYEQIKFMRVNHTANSQMLDVYVLNGQYSYYGNGDSSSAGDSDQSGFFFISEYNTGGYSEPYQKLTSMGMPLGEWVWVEQYIYAHSDPLQAKRRLWINGVFAWEQVGEDVKWRNNADTIKTGTVTGGTNTLTDSSDTLTFVRLFTYWNSYAPQNQTCYVSDIVLHKNAADLSVTDEFGNLMLGNALV